MPIQESASNSISEDLAENYADMRLLGVVPRNVQDRMKRRAKDDLGSIWNGALNGRKLLFCKQRSICVA